MNTCQTAFRHPEAQMMCYAVTSGRFEDQKGAAELLDIKPQVTADKVDIGKPNSEAEQYHAATAQLLAMARGSGKA